MIISGLKKRRYVVCTTGIHRKNRLFIFIESVYEMEGRKGEFQ